MDTRKITDILKVDGVMSQGFGLSPKIVMRDKRLTIEAKSIYSYFASFAGGGNTAFPGRDMILEELGISKTRYYKHLQLLIDCDYLRVDRERDDNGVLGRCIYTLVAKPESDFEVTSVSAVSAIKENPPVATEQSEIRAKKEKKRTSHETDPLRIQLDIDGLIKADPGSKSDLERIYLAAKDMLSCEQLKIGDAVKQRAELIELVDQLQSDNVRIALLALQENRSTIKNMRKYIQSCLANSIFDETDKLYEAEMQSEKKQKLHLEEARKEQRQQVYVQYPELRKLEAQAEETSIKLCKLAFGGESVEIEREKLLNDRKRIDAEIDSFCLKHQIDLDIFENV